MSEDKTKEKPDARSFEERVFARFDALDRRLGEIEERGEALDRRFGGLEERVDARLRDTRPIWEAVLARLDSIESEMKAMNRRVRILHDDLLHAREGQEDLRERVTKLESEPAQ